MSRGRGRCPIHRRTVERLPTQPRAQLGRWGPGPATPPSGLAGQRGIRGGSGFVRSTAGGPHSKALQKPRGAPGAWTVGTADPRRRPAAQVTRPVLGVGPAGPPDVGKPPAHFPGRRRRASRGTAAHTVGHRRGRVETASGPPDGFTTAATSLTPELIFFAKPGQGPFDGQQPSVPVQPSMTRTGTLAAAAYHWQYSDELGGRRGRWPWAADVLTGRPGSFGQQRTLGGSRHPAGLPPCPQPVPASR